MARYGQDFTGGRYTSRNDLGSGYDVGYNSAPRDSWSSGRGHGWNDRQGGGGWGGYGRSSGLGGANTGWSGREQNGGDFGGRTGPGEWSHGREFEDFGRDRGFGYGARQFGDQNYGRGGFGNQSYGGRNFQERGFNERDYGNRQFGGHEFGDRGMHAGGSRMNENYGRDFGDRVREGWHRLRNEARDMMGRGYDRGW